MPFDLHQAVVQLRQDLQELRKQRAHIEMQLVQKNIALSSLAPLIENQKEREELLSEIKAARRKPAGLREAISECLRAMPHDSFSASEVREWLQREGYDLSDYSQPLATISVTLRRLADAGKVRATRKDRKITYQWIAD